MNLKDNRLYGLLSLPVETCSFGNQRYAFRYTDTLRDSVFFAITGETVPAVTLDAKYA